MSIKKELSNTASYLRSARKAILGRGGEISQTAGLKDLPDAIFNIPADASLAHYMDEEITYRKNVPVGAEKYALLKSVGGMTYKSKNLLDLADGTYMDNGITITVENQKISFSGTAKKETWTKIGTVVLNAGNYMFSSPQGSNGLGVYLYGNSQYTTIKRQSIIVTQTETYYIIIQVLDRENDASSFGEIELMLNEGTTALPYEPYYEGLRDSKVTEIVSYGRNLLVARANVTEFTPYREPISKPIPKAIQDLDGYGWGINADCYNYIDYENKQFVKMVDKDENGDVFELAEPIITDISKILAGDNFIEVEGGGALEFVNEYQNAVPSTVKYIVKAGI